MIISGTTRLRLFIWPICSLVLGVYLWNANEWIPHWLLQPGEQVLHSTAPLDILPELIQYSVDDVETNPSTRMQKVSLSGWILPTKEWREPDAEATHCEIIFKGERGWYRIIPENFERKDVLDIFHVDNKNTVTGFKARFTPVVMKEGTYEMGLVVRAGTKDIAVVWSSYVFIQDRQGFRHKDK